MLIRISVQEMTKELSGARLTVIVRGRYAAPTDALKTLSTASRSLRAIIQNQKIKASLLQIVWLLKDAETQKDMALRQNMTIQGSATEMMYAVISQSLKPKIFDKGL